DPGRCGVEAFVHQEGPKTPPPHLFLQDENVVLKLFPPLFREALLADLFPPLNGLAQALSLKPFAALRPVLFSQVRPAPILKISKDSRRIEFKGSQLVGVFSSEVVTSHIVIIDAT